MGNEIVSIIVKELYLKGVISKFSYLERYFFSMHNRYRIDFSRICNSYNPLDISLRIFFNLVLVAIFVIIVRPILCFYDAHKLKTMYESEKFNSVFMKKAIVNMTAYEKVLENRNE